MPYFRHVWARIRESIKMISRMGGRFAHLRICINCVFVSIVHGVTYGMILLHRVTYATDGRLVVAPDGRRTLLPHAHTPSDRQDCRLTLPAACTAPGAAIIIIVNGPNGQARGELGETITKCQLFSTELTERWATAPNPNT